MNDITIEDLLEIVRSYNPEAVDDVFRAYCCAEKLHQGVKRQSGEPYIIHPLNVCFILAELHMDSDTLCAGLLHDVVEDTFFTKEDVERAFNKDVSELVDGVTKLRRMNFSTKQEQNLANMRKIITSIIKDIRIIIIKLADRLHNMRTLQFKIPEKQRENALETLEVFVPLAYFIGAYRIKSELEDLSLMYLKPEEYQEIKMEKQIVEEDSHKCLQDMYYSIKGMLNSQNIYNEISIRTKNICGIYKAESRGKKLFDINDLLALKIMVSNEVQCYHVLGMIHHKYHPINDRFKDYICNPKTNMYQALHTTVFGEDERIVQAQIRTFDMDRVASFGITAYWDIYKDKARDKMQEELRKKYQFFSSLKELDDIFEDNLDFVTQIKMELFSDRVYIYTPKGDIIELPKGATPIDVAYRIHTELGNSMTGVLVNNEVVPVGYVLKNKDRIKIICGDGYVDRKNWDSVAYTAHAKRKIKEYKSRC